MTLWCKSDQFHGISPALSSQFSWLTSASQVCFFFLCQCKSFPQQRLRTKQTLRKWDPHDRHGGCNPAPVLQPAAALLCPHLQPWEPAPGHGRAQTDAALRGAGWRENANYPDAAGTLQDFNEQEPEAGTGFEMNQNTRLNSQLSP